MYEVLSFVVECTDTSSCSIKHDSRSQFHLINTAAVAVVGFNVLSSSVQDSVVLYCTMLFTLLSAAFGIFFWRETEQNAFEDICGGDVSPLASLVYAGMFQLFVVLFCTYCACSNLFESAFIKIYMYVVFRAKDKSQFQIVFCGLLQQQSVIV